MRLAEKFLLIFGFAALAAFAKALVNPPMSVDVAAGEYLCVDETAALHALNPDLFAGGHRRHIVNDSEK